VTARILIVDDVAANVRLLEARLQAEYFDVRTAFNGRDALEIAGRERLDLIVLDVMMPDMSGFEVCAALKADGRTAHVPVIMVTALDQPEDRVKGLESGADDFLTKPVSDVALVTRVKSLVRLKMVTDELALRSAAFQSAGLASADLFAQADDRGGRILVVDDRENSSGRLRHALQPRYDVEFAGDSAEALAKAGAGAYDLLILSLKLRSGDGLRLCTQIKAMDGLRQTPVLLVTDTDDSARVMRALELGINDYIIRPIDVNELRARVRTQLRRKRYAEQLRTMVTSAVELAITDPLTGLYNRRYLDSHLRSVVSRAVGHCQARLPAALRHRLLQGHQRQLRPRCRATTSCAISPTACAAACAASTCGALRRARSSSRDARTRMRALPHRRGAASQRCRESAVHDEVRASPFP
jgi:two-component system cell cycle response regulator